MNSHKRKADTIIDESIIKKKKEDHNLIIEQTSLCNNKTSDEEYNDCISNNLLEITKEEKSKKSFKCLESGCDSSFTRNTSLKRHMKDIHNKIQSFKCDRDDCNSIFTQYRYLKQHIKTVH